MTRLWAETAVVGGAGGTGVAIRDGRIAYVGSDDAVRELVRAETRVVDARGGRIAPAFVDSHTHFHRASIMEYLYLNFEKLEPTSIGQVLDLVRARAAGTSDDAWIQGDSLDASRLAERRLPTRHELDAAAPGRCVVLRTVGRHALSASSAALRTAGIDAQTTEPAGGRIEREADGEPNGVLHEHGKLRLDMTRADTVVPRPTAAQRQVALEDGMRRLAGHGIAAIHDIVREPTEIADYIDLDVSGRLHTRIRLYVRGRESQTPLEFLTGLGLRRGFGSDWLRLAGVKLSIDGDLANRNAAVYEPYPDEPDNVGLLRLTADELTDAVVRSHEAALPVAVHAIGPKAVDMALDAVAEAQRRAPQQRLTHRIEHAFFAQREGRLKRFADLGVVWSTQVSMLYSEGDAWVAAAGRAFLDGVLPLRTALGMGVAVQINSDYPCSPLSPLVGLRAAVERRTRDGEVLADDEAITSAEAIALMTASPAATVGESQVSGEVAVGNWADLIVLSPDPDIDGPPGPLDLRVDATLAGGHVVYARDEAGAA
jgi:predicted amidohydrolase YtcJ